MTRIHRIAAASLLTWASAFVTGCSSGQHSSGGSEAPASSGAARRAGDGRTLEQRASAERTGKPRAAEAPLPPGLEPGSLAMRAQDDARAWLSLEDALRDVAPAEANEPPPATGPAEVSSDQQAAALKAYAKGRAAALDNRHLQAVIELQKALAIDPDAPQVLRELARSYDASGNQQRAYEMLERLVKVAPDDADALYALGVAAATRREFDQAAHFLARLRRGMDSRAREVGMGVIVDFTLATSLRELGYDRAFIELSRQVVDMPQQLAAASPSSRIASVYRQRGDLLRGAGDAYARLGEFPHAIDAWSAAAALPSADPSSLHPRIIYANLRMGRPYSAQSALLDALRLSTAVGPVTDREVRLCEYVARNAKPVDLLADEVLTLQKAHPDDGGCVRAAAMLLPGDRALAMLRDFVERRPNDVQALSQLLEWVGRDDPAAAAALTISLAEAQPARADKYSDAYGQASPGYSAAIKSVRGQPESPAQAGVLTRLLLRAGSLGEAWVACQAALERWPTDRALRLRAVEIAAAMQEPALVNRAINACGDINDIPGLITLSQARRSLAQSQPALELAMRAAAMEPDNVDAQIELARAHHAHAVVLGDDPANAVEVRTQTSSAVAAANRAIELDPLRDDAYETLTLIYGPGGVLADSQEFRDALLRLRQANPQSPLYNRLAAQDSLSQRRFDQALERLINAYDGNPSDAAALGLAVATWERSGDLEAAEAWLREKLTQRPGDAILREQLLRVQVLRKHEHAAVAELEAQVEADAEDWTARRLLESAYRLTGQRDAALKLSERRLLDRPEGVRREIELAAMYVGAELAEKALRHLERVRELAADATNDDLLTAMSIAARIQGADDRRDAVTLDLAHIAIERDPRSPLQVYGFALRAIAREEIRTGASDGRFETLIREATAKSRGADDTSFVGARLWQELAQALVAENLTEAAARTLRVRLSEKPEFEPAAFGALARVVIVIDAEAAYQAGPQNAQAAGPIAQRTTALLRELQENNLLQRVFELQGPVGLAEALYESSVFYTLVGAEAGSEALMRECLTVRPDDAMVLNNLGYMLLERGVSDAEVAAMIDKAGRTQPSESNILDTVGWLRYKQGRVADGEGVAARDAADPAAGAVTLIQKALDSSTDPSPEVFDHLGDAKWRMGDEQGAIEAWKRVVSALDDGSFKQNLIQNVAAVQARQWGIIVMGGERMYEREYAPVLQRAQEKLAAASRGEQPAIAPQWPKE